MRERTHLVIANTIRKIIAIAAVIVVVTSIAVALGQTVKAGLVLSAPALVVVEYIRNGRRK